ncbi:MAG: hypothetical protein LBV18_07435 [Alistipes sp.]|jgi:hypothetical protein|nr:hypothetical protein [Alistipes sp.]
MNESDRSVGELVDELSKKMLPKYREIKCIFDNPYDYLALDPLRVEVCKCIIFDLHQAAITLTNHLLEYSLKFCLGLKHSKDNKNDAKTLGDAFAAGVEKYDNMPLADTINAACSQGLISKEQKKQLHEFRKDFRNAWSHASSSKMFGDNTVPVGTVTTDDLNRLGLDGFIEHIFTSNDTIETKIKNVPFIGAVIKARSSRNASIPYFRAVDAVIRAMLSNLSSSTQTRRAADSH